MSDMRRCTQNSRMVSRDRNKSTFPVAMVSTLFTMTTPVRQRLVIYTI